MSLSEVATPDSDVVSAFDVEVVVSVISNEEDISSESNSIPSESERIEESVNPVASEL
jgi:hypothetical protein